MFCTYIHTYINVHTCILNRILFRFPYGNRDGRYVSLDSKGVPYEFTLGSHIHIRYIGTLNLKWTDFRWGTKKVLNVYYHMVSVCKYVCIYE